MKSNKNKKLSLFSEETLDSMKMAELTGGAVPDSMCTNIDTILCVNTDCNCIETKRCVKYPECVTPPRIGICVS